MILSHFCFQVCWEVLEHLMGDILNSNQKEIPTNVIRKLYEKKPGVVKFEKMPRSEGDEMASVTVEVCRVMVVLYIISIPDEKYCYMQ